MAFSGKIKKISSFLRTPKKDQQKDSRLDLYSLIEKEAEYAWEKVAGKPDWGNVKQRKYFIKDGHVSFCYVGHVWGGIYFPTERSASKAIERIKS